MSESVDRREFVKTGVAAGAAMAFTAASYDRVYGANENLRIGFIGVGGRCQQHVDVILKMQAEKKGVVPVAACDVWDGDPMKGFVRATKTYNGQGLLPTAKRCGLDLTDKKHVTKDYRVILDQKDVDIVTIATPDHWHARMTIDALTAGKQVYCEKPMTRTIAEAHAVVDAWKKTGHVMSVGVQSMADPTWRMAYDHIKAGNIGKVLMGQTSYFRNSDVGQWRYYSLTKNMNPSTINWDMFLGTGYEVGGEKIGPTAKEVPFDRAIFGQWRCYWPFGGGMFTDLFVHQTTHLIAAMGVRYPRRVVGAGGIYMEYDTRDVPDVATIAADYDEGCQLLISSTMCNDHRIDECIRGHSATLVFDSKPRDPADPTKGREFGYTILPQSVKSAPAGPGGAIAKEGTWVPGGLLGDDTYALWTNFLHCVQNKNQDTFSTPALGAAAFTTVNMGALSYRTGKALFWDKEARKAVEADPSWAAAWEKRSKERGKPNHIMGWEGGDKGSALIPPDYMKLAGPWVDGKDPAGE
ncbi:MAG: Gfo/Idh/MocA family oxidoreductase [Gemmataceae bacterium]|nr:Gfo/Idh/MocA family oxidoreductase [Gemmataceae bacterium]